MQIARLLDSLDVRSAHGDVRGEVRRVSRDSRDVDAHTAFVAIRGAHFDGHAHLNRLSGAALLVVEDPGGAPEGVPCWVVDDTRVALARIAAALEGHPARSMRVIGVTGTKGKTTITTLIEGALAHAGRTAGRIGTTGSSVGGRPIPSALTTPEAPELQRLLATMRDAGATVVAMEVSSIGLVQRRVEAIPFHFAIFSNLGHDHLDFHGTMEAYRDAKAHLFRELLRDAGGAPRAALCADDPVSTQMGAPADVWTYGFSPAADFRIERCTMASEGMRLTLRTPLGMLELQSPLIGRHNAQNLTAALSALVACGVSAEEACAGLASVASVPGRLEVVANPGGALVVVDYAHTPESLAAILETLREVVKGRLWVVFGCGGDRDVGKRPAMGAIAAHWADEVVVTSDNPRSEDPLAIIAAIVAGIPSGTTASGSVVCSDPDRARAIGLAVSSAKPGDVVLIAGKGHETYQEAQGVRSAFDDREVAREAIRGKHVV
jgi:UDP-N-acetylmuramoyl-L-alanyl-D-glutamate--2,6-diaminopimelate ligase